MSSKRSEQMNSKTKSRLPARAIFAGALVALWSTASAQGGGQLYFTDLFNPNFETGYIHRVNTDGTGLTQLVDAGGGLRGLDLDIPAGKMYWGDVNTWKIRRSNLDGSGQEDLINLSGIGED